MVRTAILHGGICDYFSTARSPRPSGLGAASLPEGLFGHSSLPFLQLAGILRNPTESHNSPRQNVSFSLSTKRNGKKELCKKCQSSPLVSPKANNLLSETVRKVFGKWGKSRKVFGKWEKIGKYSENIRKVRKVFGKYSENIGKCSENIRKVGKVGK